MSHLAERLLLFRHDYKSPNILQLVNSASDVIDETLIEIVLTSSRKWFFHFEICAIQLNMMTKQKFYLFIFQQFSTQIIMRIYQQ